ncbi:MAG: hypothetical protein ACREEM_45465 [Blastocatellia bacterium]
MPKAGATSVTRRGGIDRRHLHAGDNCPGRVGDDPGDRRLRRLRQQKALRGDRD